MNGVFLSSCKDIDSPCGGKIIQLMSSIWNGTFQLSLQFTIFQMREICAMRIYFNKLDISCSYTNLNHHFYIIWNNILTISLWINHYIEINFLFSYLNIHDRHSMHMIKFIGLKRPYSSNCCALSLNVKITNYQNQNEFYEANSIGNSGFWNYYEMWRKI